MDDKFDCIIVGGGVAGLAAGMTLARGGAKFLLVERGEFCGAKNVSGGVLWGTDLNQLVPDYWTIEDAGFERFIGHRRLSFMDEQSCFSIDFKSSHYEEPPYSGVSVLRAKFDAWLASQVEEAIAHSPFPDESFLATDILVEDVVRKPGGVIGIVTGGETFYADCLIIAEGVNNLLTRKVGLQSEYVPSDHVGVGVKEVIKFDRSVLEDRFQLRGRSGFTNEYVGWASQGIEGGGFLYTNYDSLSVGLVLGMKDLQRKKKKPYDVLNEFKAHPAVADILRGGEVLEYSAHVVSTGDIRAMPSEVFDDQVMIAGEAAGLLMNSGKAIQGMDFAMRSGILAAETALQAREASSFDRSSLGTYRSKLEKSFVLADMKTFQDAVHLLHSPAMFDKVPNLLCDFGRKFFTIDGQPTRKARDIFRESVKEHSSYLELAKIGFKASRAL